ncbi:Transcriptional regulator, LysR family [hydrothermal vent metagenome]|uniref:Transcriptional regulator, LysR family n=1 Tax=hydrothermal vent metagenome TaxID=652676 RepID=A0A3B0YD32_9ZZZZ
MPPDLNATALFVKVVEYKSFSEASRRLGVPISTVSRKVSDLEKTLGVRLLERSTRQLRLTELGQDYYAYCRRGIEEIETGTLMLSERQAEISGTLRLSIPPGLADRLIVPLASAFQEAYPAVTIRILITERMVDFIQDAVDLALRVGDLKDSSLVARPLIHYRHVLVSSPGYLDAFGLPAHPRDLSAHRMITFNGWFDNASLKLIKGRKAHRVKVEGVLALNDYAGILSAVESGQGIAEIPSIICGEALHDGRLVEVMPDWRFAPTMLSAVYPGNRNLSRIVRLFKDFCIEQIRALSPYANI